MGGRSRLAVLAFVVVAVTACGGGQGKWAFPTGVEARADPCKIAVNRLAGFTERMADDIVSLRTLLVAKVFDSAETARGVKDVSATLTSYPDLQQVTQACDATAGLAARVEALEMSATTAVTPSLAASPVFEGEVHWLAAYNLVELLSETMSLSAAAQAAGEPLAIVVAVAADPAGSSPPEIPLGPFVTSTPDYQAFADRLVRRGADFNALLDEEMPNLPGVNRGEERRIGRRIVTYSDSEITWLNRHKPEKCYGAIWRAVLGAWTDIRTAGHGLMDGTMSDAVQSMGQARNHLNTLLDRDYVSEANARCVTAPGATP